MLELGIGAAGGSERIEADRAALNRGGEVAPAEVVPPPASGVAGGKGRCFACLCEDVTAHDISHALDEGFDPFPHLDELLARRATVVGGHAEAG